MTVPHTSATDAQLSQSVERTPVEILSRYRSNRNWRYYEKEWIYRRIPVQGKTVLDFGCGTGEISTQLAALGAEKVLALDVAPGLLDMTRRRAIADGVSDRVETICGSVENLAPQPVDTIVSFAVLHHCFPLDRSVPAILGWLKPGGYFVASEPVTYSRTLDWLRDRSGVPTGPLDPGERKLNEKDVAYLRSLFSEVRVVHFRLLGRLTRLFPRADFALRVLDRLLLSIPGAWRFAGIAVIVGKK